ncbi:MAG: hypothetical protein JO041_08665 [Acidobacteria bacterium]|nr:hypothetical protein [Acidobacteriota bacterium]
MNRIIAFLLVIAAVVVPACPPAAAQSGNIREAVSGAVRSAVNSAVNAMVDSSVQLATNLALENALSAALAAAVPPVEINFDDAPDAACPDHSETNFGDDLRTYSAVEQHTLPVTIGSVFVHGAHNGGVSVRGWDRNEIQVTACKYAGAENDAEGRQRLADIHINISGGDISTSGPDQNGDRHWTVHFLVRAPSSVALRLEAYNGPMSVRETGSDVEANTVNGPLTLKLATGNVQATTRNGPLTVSDCSGKITASAQNGPLTVSLNDRQWRGAGLEASTHNGPLTVRVPEGYLSGVDVDAGGHSPFSCSLRDCNSVQSSKPWDRTTHVHLGSGNTAVHVSTVNGPVHIGSSME